MGESLSRLQCQLLSRESTDQVKSSRLIELTARFASLFPSQDGTVEFKGTKDDLKNLVMDVLLITAQLEINMEQVIWMKYPGICSYCSACPCRCGRQKERPAEQLKLRIPPGQVLSIKYFQDMLGRIYPKGRHSLHEVVEHVVEEIGELTDALSIAHQDGVNEEAADVFAWLMQVSNTLRITLDDD